jgi:hypothetical protein
MSGLTEEEEMNKKKIARATLAVSGIATLAVIGYYVVTTIVIIHKMTRGEER